MNKQCLLEISDEVNVRFHGLDVATRRKLVQKLEFVVPYAKHLPLVKLGLWNGKKSYCDVAGRTYLNLLEDLLPIVRDAGYIIDLDDQRRPMTLDFSEVSANSYTHVKWPKGHVHEGVGVELRDHQVEVLNSYLTNPQSIQEVSTGAGKTIISAILSDKISHYGRSIVIVPSKDLVTQTERDFKLLGLDTGVYYGERKEPWRQHTICTWQSIESLDRKSSKYDSTLDMDIFTKDVAGVIVDEAHRIKGDVLKKHLTTTFKDVPIRWAMTGTLPLEDMDLKALVSAVGPVVNTVSAKDLQDKGILSNLHIKAVQIADYINTFSNYASELKYLVTDRARLEYIASYILENNSSGNSLILVDRIETGKILLDLLPNSEFISGNVKSSDRKDCYDSFADTDGKCAIATYGVAAVGIDIPRIFNLFMIEPGKSYIRVIQSIGRGIRKAKDKDYVDVYDISSTAKYSRRHLNERKRFYNKANYPYTLIKRKLV